MDATEAVVQRVRAAAYGWVERADSVLLCRIAAPDAGAGRWMLPGGGLDFGEDPVDGVLRELREETGLTGIVDGLLGVRSAVLEPHATARADRIHAVAILYRVTAVEADLVVEVGGSTDLAAWVPFAELDTLPTVPLVGWARELAGR
jgi:ADP-ribose pyrophosphatase YjhB (NUDIX family)